MEGENRIDFLIKIEVKDYKPIEFLKNYLQLYEEKIEKFTMVEKSRQKMKCG